MNTLSWMIYAADVVGALNALSGLVTVVAAPIAGASAAHIFIDEPKGEKLTTARRMIRNNLIVTAIFSAICVFTPSKDTIYAIAASEMGEEVIKSPTAGKAMKALDAWLNAQIKEVK